MQHRFDEDKLLEYGFVREGAKFFASFDIPVGQMKAIASIENDVLSIKIMDETTSEEYVLHRTGATGGFVGEVRAAYNGLIDDIETKCTERDPYYKEQPRLIIEYARQRYGDEPEFLWEDDDSAVLRRKDNRKWYAVFMNVNRKKFGEETDKVVPVLNVRIKIEDGDGYAEEGFYPAFHMNKKHWISIILDGRSSTERIEKLLSDSYILALKK